ncbi:hypothetical protein GmHk_03G007476 [Glycine max]|nr:hypothetical protein GmHk_03G007476 [Glycine max]
MEGNEETFELHNWITDIHGDAIQIKNFIMNHDMRLAIFNRFTPLRLLSVADSRFASIIVMLKRFKLIKRGLGAMAISQEWSSYREDDTGKANFVKENIVNDDCLDKVDYIIDFTKPIYDMIQVCDTNRPCLHLVYEMWDSMIEKVKLEIYKKEKLSHSENCPFYDAVYQVLIACWTKSYTSLHCLAHSLNPRYYSDGWLHEDHFRVTPHRDAEISRERMKCFWRLFPSSDNFDKVYDEYDQFSLMTDPFEDPTSLSKRYSSDPINWWANFGVETLHSIFGFRVTWTIDFFLLFTYSFIQSLRRNRLNPSHVEDLVYIHNNLCLLSRNSNQYENEKTKMWDVGCDTFDSMEDVGFLEFAELSLYKPELENGLIPRMLTMLDVFF